MEISEHITALAAEGSRLLGAAGSAGLEAAVPSCPGWTVRDLLRHQGGVHRWATSVVATPRTEPWDVELEEVVGDWPADADLLDWCDDGHAALVAALSAAPPDLRCWTFLPAPSPLAMWARRQAHETTVHRVDAELAAASVAVLPPAAAVPVLPPAGVSVLLPPAGLAADGVDELLGAFLPRPGRATGRAGEAPARILVRCTDVEAGWLVTVSPDGVTTEPARSAPEAGAVVAAPAAELYLALWRRAGADGLAMQGDRTPLDRLLERTRVLWS